MPCRALPQDDATIVGMTGARQRAGCGSTRTFGRQDFGRNRLRDVVVLQDGRNSALPVGVVSKRYALVQHGEAVASVIEELKKLEIDPARVSTNLQLSEYGTRLALRAALPKAFDLTPADGHAMSLTFECFNSVDGSVPLFAAVGWFRLICANGLVVGTTTAKVRQRHTPSLNLGEFSAVLASGMREAVRDRAAFGQWQATPISKPQLDTWLGSYVHPAWGVLAAARVHHITQTGCDGMPKRSGRTHLPQAWPVMSTERVPGTVVPCSNAYQVAQVLAWVASRRADITRRLQWRAQISDLITQLIAEAA